jgi:diguanylate cyclase (GGDEF)-like protein
LDGFKDINDEHGHEIGDHVLRTTAERITSVVRGSDIVGRIGGDEYGVVITDYERPEELEIVLDRIISVLHTPIWIGDLSVSTSGSVGIALYPEDGTKADELVRDADAAMYAIKRKGGNSYTYFAESINAAADERRRLRATLATALIRGEFELHNQPIV